MARTWRVVGTLAVAVAVLAPVWSSAVLPTGDGPSHVYNAFVANELARTPALGDVYELGPAVRPQLLSDSFLRLAGPALGWELAERVLFTLIVVGGVAALAAFPGVRDPSALALLAWIPAGWFSWMGFYDFALGLAFFALLVRSLDRAEPRAPHGWMLCLLLSHLFLAACGCVLLGARWVTDRTRGTLAAWLGWSVVVVALLAVATPGGVAPPVPAPNGIAHVLTSDAVISHDPAGMLAGFCLFVVAAAGAWSRCRRPGWFRLTGWLAICFLVASLATPEWIGRGGYVPTRMRVVGLVLLVPHGLAALRRGRVPARTLAVACGLVAWGVLLHQARHTHAYAARLAATVQAVDEAIEALGAEPGGMALKVRDPFQQPGFGRVFAHERIPERLAIRRGWPILDNYEAGEPVFRVRWRDGVAPLSLELSDSALAVGGPWSGALYLVHDRDVVPTSPRGVGATVPAPPFAMTLVPAGSR